MAPILRVVLALALAIAAVDAAATKGCSWNVNKHLPNPQPIVLKGDSDVPEFQYPQDGDTVILRTGDSLRLLCSGSSNLFTHNKSAKSKEITATCMRGTQFSVDGKSYNIKELKCKSHAVNEVQKNGTCLNGQYTRIDVGFNAGDSFLPLMELCFDEQNLDPVYSRFTLTPSIEGYQSGFPRPAFSPSTFYDAVPINKQYNRKQQKTTLNAILGSNLGNKYIKDSGDFFFARGHLTAKADFVYGAQHRATFYYMNSAPQWQSFNVANWNELEGSVRRFAASRGLSLEVTTGVWDVATLPDADGVEKPLYLYADENNNHAITIPKYYWKVVHDPETRAAVAFVGMNNPYHETTPEDVFCKDVCSKYDWISWDRKNQEKGYSFCCDVNEFRKTVTTLPDFEVESLLV